MPSRFASLIGIENKKAFDHEEDHEDGQIRWCLDHSKSEGSKDRDPRMPNDTNQARWNRA
jgi:hypothetical protein